MTEQPEPNGWELLRGVNEVKKAIQDLSTGFVSQQLFAMYQAAQADADKTRDSLIQKIESDAVITRRAKAQQWFFIGLAVLTSIAGVVAWLIETSVAH